MEFRKYRYVGLLSVAALCLALAATPNRLHSQEAAEAPPASEEAESGPDEPDRLGRIEQQLRKLESHNDRLQKRYDDLQRQYNALRRQATEPVFGAQAGNADGKGIPNGVEFGHSFVMQKKESKEGTSGGAEGREQTGEGGAGESVEPGKRRTYEPEEEGEEDREVTERRPSLEGTAPRRAPRRQSGVSGAGVSAGPESPRQSMEAYVNEMGVYKPNMRPPRLPLTASFSQGMELRSADEFFTVEFHNLSQFDYHDFSRTGDALHDNFFIPRQRWYFQGQVTPYAYYYTVINRGYGTIDLLDSWADFNFWPRYKEKLQIRVGRSKVPFNYEYIKISESDLIAPERSILVGNFSGNRQVGVMLHGQLFERSMEYFFGLYNGPQRSFVSYDNSKTIYSFINTKPFLHSGIEWLEQLNLSGSWNGGVQRDPLQPAFLTTANDQSPSATVENVSPTFLVFNNKAFENGMRMFWGGDVAYYYKSFMMYGGYQGGFVQYSLYNTPLNSNTIFYDGSSAFAGYGSSQRTTVPIVGWNVAMTYFITGEEITRRVYLVEPKRPFGYYNGRLNPGAIELYARFANMQLGDQVFTSGIANPKYWSNRASATDIGVNWYLNNYVRIYLDWQHAMFGSPVFLSADKYMKQENLYWFRTQVFF